MTPDELYALIAQGESETLEFKRFGLSAADVAEVVVCLANSQGGLLLLGVEDDGRVSGCPKVSINTLRRGIYSATNPALILDVHKVPTPDGAVVVIRVPRSPVIVATTSGRYLRRVGADCLPVSPAMLPRLMVEKGQLDYSANLVSDGDWADLDPRQIGRLREMLSRAAPDSEMLRLSDADLCLGLDLVRREGGTLRPTVLGLLVAGTEAALYRAIPQHEVVYIHHPYDTTDYDQREDMRRPLLDALERLTELVETRNPHRALYVGLQRLEIASFARPVYREAILNALVHRDYIVMGPVYVQHLPDRLIIENPGGLPEGITPTNIITHQPRHRNPALALFCQRLHLVERAGAGVDRMYRLLLTQGKEPPQFVDQRDSMRLILRDTDFDEPFARFVAEWERDEGRLTLDQLITLAHLHKSSAADVGEVAAACQRSHREAQEVLDGLVTMGLLAQGGPAETPIYALAGPLQERLGRVRAMTRGEQAGRVLAFVQERGRITNRECQELCGLSRDQAKRLLRRLVQRGGLVRRGTGKATQYKAPPE